jgi:hypothetical protein
LITRSIGPADGSLSSASSVPLSVESSAICICRPT